MNFFLLTKFINGLLIPIHWGKFGVNDTLKFEKLFVDKILKAVEFHRHETPFRLVKN